MCLSFCQTQTGFVVKAEVVRWRKARLPGHPREIEIKVLLSRYWTLAGDNSEEQGSLEARIGHLSEKRDTRSRRTGHIWELAYCSVDA